MQRAGSRAHIHTVALLAAFMWLLMDHQEVQAKGVKASIASALMLVPGVASSSAWRPQPCPAGGRDHQLLRPLPRLVLSFGEPGRHR